MYSITEIIRKVKVLGIGIIFIYLCFKYTNIRYLYGQKKSILNIKHFEK